MSIAQRSVAGEGGTHPEDSEALIAYRSDDVNLPWIIFRAAFRASHVEDLPQRARSVLAALARTVDAAKPYAAIFARRDLLTGRAMQSMRTFYRSLDDLEIAGLIERRPQSRYVEAGLFGRAYLHLTEKAALLLGLVEPPAPEPQEAAPASFERPSASMADGGIYKVLFPVSFQKRQPGQIPADLQRLRALGFSDFLIFKLMRTARENGKRLSDVVELTWQHLKKAHHPINYLGSLLRSPVDFGHQLRQKQADDVDAQERRQRAQHAEIFAKHSADQTFESLDGKLQYRVDATGENMTVYSVEEGIQRQAVNWKEGFAAALSAKRVRKLVVQSTIGTAVVEGKAPVTAVVRGHIAGLRSLLGMRAAQPV